MQWEEDGNPVIKVDCRNEVERPLHSDGLFGVPDSLNRQSAVPNLYDEGAQHTAIENVYERNPQARKECITHSGLRCQVCDLDFEERYGELGKGFIHVHHLKPLSEIGSQYQVNPVRDLRPVCPNCHSMLHQKSPPLKIEELRCLLKPDSKQHAMP